MASYVVKGAYVTAPVSSDQGTVILGFHRGAVLPGSVPEAHIKHLISVDLVEEFDEGSPVNPFPVPNSTGPLGIDLPEGEVAIGLPLPEAKVEEVGLVSVDADEAQRPAGNASREQWVEYAVSQGMDRDEAEGYTRDELRERY